MTRVTGLRARSGGRVAVELDGELWRVLPVDVVVRAHVSEGRELDRAALREVRRQLRRHEALAGAARALRHRDLSRRALDARLDRAGTAPAARAEALRTLEGLGALDDVRLAGSRADSLAGRGYGDAAIRADLHRRGLADPVIADAIGGLDGEAERARRIVGERGGSRRTAAFLARRGFEAETIESAIANGCGGE